MRLSTLYCLALSLSGVLVNAETFSSWQFPKGHFDTVLEQFDEGWEQRWRISHAKKDDEFSYVGKWAVEEPKIAVIEGDKGLVLKTPAAHHAISTIFENTFLNEDKDLVLQYEVKTQEDLTCGGAYLKLLTASSNLKDEEFSDETPYQVMFGPDRCGSTNKVHFIVRRKNPKTGEYEEKHLRTAPMSKITKLTTLYTLIVKNNNDFEIRINGEVAKAGNLLDETLFTPSFNPPKQIPDENDTKPEDWDDNITIPDPEQLTKPEDWDEDAPRKISDPEATKPADWDEEAPAYIPDPEAEIPEDWDEEEDGEYYAAEIPNPECENHGCGPWEAPLIPNPNYKGKWVQPMIENPNYKGEWEPRLIDNPDYYVDENASDLEPIGGIGIELWTMNKNILFDNIYLGHSIPEAEAIGNSTFGKKLKLEEALEKEANKEIDDEVANPYATNEEEDSFADQINYYIGEVTEFVLNFLEDANNYMIHLVEDPVYVLTERRAEGIVYAVVFGFLFTVFFGVFAIILLKITSETDSSVDAKFDDDEVKEAKKDLKEKSDQKLEKIDEGAAAKTSSAETAETKVEKRS